MGIAFAILALLIIGAVVGSALNFASVFLGIPLVLVFVGALIGKETMERQQKILQMKRFRRESRTRKVEFDATDKRTMV